MGKKVTHDDFVARIANINSEIKICGKYTRMKDRINVKCIYGHEWSPTADSLSQGHGCPQCTAIDAGKKHRRSHESFALELKEISPDIELLSEYITRESKISCKGNICGHTWITTPESLLQGHRCPECGFISIKNKKTKTHEEFVRELKEINPNIEILSKYRGCKEKVDCRCTIDGHEWSNTPDNLINNKTGCPKCSVYHRRANQEFIDEMSTINPNLEILTEFTNVSTKVTCRCKKDGHVWGVVPNDILHGKGCPKCAKVYRRTHDEFVEEVCSLSPNIEVIGKFINEKTNIKCKCKIDGNIWNASPYKLLNGSGCPVCKSSKGEQSIQKWLNEHLIGFESQKSFENLVGTGGGLLSYDFYVPKFNLLIEYQGEQHEHPVDFDGVGCERAEERFKNQLEHDRRKGEYAKSNNIELLEIWYYDFDNIDEILKNKFGDG